VSSWADMLVLYWCEIPSSAQGRQSRWHTNYGNVMLNDVMYLECTFSSKTVLEREWMTCWHMLKDARDKTFGNHCCCVCQKSAKYVKQIFCDCSWLRPGSWSLRAL